MSHLNIDRILHTEDGLYTAEPCVLHELLHFLLAMEGQLLWEGRRSEAKVVAAGLEAMARAMAPMLELGYPECPECPWELMADWREAATLINGYREEEEHEGGA